MIKSRLLSLSPDRLLLSNFHLQDPLKADAYVTDKEASKHSVRSPVILIPRDAQVKRRFILGEQARLRG